MHDMCTHNEIIARSWGKLDNQITAWIEQKYRSSEVKFVIQKLRTLKNPMYVGWQI